MLNLLKLIYFFFYSRSGQKVMTLSRFYCIWLIFADVRLIINILNSSEIFYIFCTGGPRNSRTFYLQIRLFTLGKVAQNNNFLVKMDFFYSRIQFSRSKMKEWPISREFRGKPGVDFINYLRTAFTLVEPKSVKKTVKSSVFLRFRDLWA